MRQRQTCQGLVPRAVVLRLESMAQPWECPGREKRWRTGSLVQHGRRSSAFDLLFGKGLWAKALKTLSFGGLCLRHSPGWQACHHSPETGLLRKKEKVTSLDKQG